MNQEEFLILLKKHKDYIEESNKRRKHIESSLELLYNKCIHDETHDLLDYIETEYEGLILQTKTICDVCNRVINIKEK